MSEQLQEHDESRVNLSIPSTWKDVPVESIVRMYDDKSYFIVKSHYVTPKVAHKLERYIPGGPHSYNEDLLTIPDKPDRPVTIIELPSEAAIQQMREKRIEKVRTDKKSGIPYPAGTMAAIDQSYDTYRELIRKITGEGA